MKPEQAIGAVALLACGLLALGCGPPKGAEDPRSFMDDRFGDSASVDWEAGSRDELSDDDEVRATRAMCRSAALRIEALAYESVVLAELDPARQSRLREAKHDWLTSKETVARINEVTQSCLENKTSAREANCVAGASTAAAVADCEH